MKSPSDFRKILDAGRPLVADGAWGTELAKRGLTAGTVPETWNASRPEAVRDLAAAYAEAGAGIVLTNTFGGNEIKLARGGLAARVGELNFAGARLSVQGVAGRALVFASVGPTGEMLEPHGDLSETEARRAFADQIRWLAEGGADGIVVETMSDLNEAKLALAAARESCALPVVVCLTFEPGAAGPATIMGVRPEDAARELTAAGADMVGANCGAGIEAMIEVARLLRSGTALPLWIKPNAGKPELVAGETLYRETPAEFAARMPELVAAGAAVVGGCCGTTPEHVRALAEAAKTLRSGKK